MPSDPVCNLNRGWRYVVLLRLLFAGAHPEVAVPAGRRVTDLTATLRPRKPQLEQTLAAF